MSVNNINGNAFERFTQSQLNRKNNNSESQLPEGYIKSRDDIIKKQDKLLSKTSLLELAGLSGLGVYYRNFAKDKAQNFNDLLYKTDKSIPFLMLGGAIFYLSSKSYDINKLNKLKEKYNINTPENMKPIDKVAYNLASIKGKEETREGIAREKSNIFATAIALITAGGLSLINVIKKKENDCLNNILTGALVSCLTIGIKELISGKKQEKISKTNADKK